MGWGTLRIHLDGLLIPGALLSLCILLCLNRINLIRSDGNLLSWLSFGILRLAFSPIRTVPEESDRPVFYTPPHVGSSFKQLRECSEIS